MLHLTYFTIISLLFKSLVVFHILCLNFCYFSNFFNPLFQHGIRLTLSYYILFTVLISFGLIQSASAQFQTGGVDYPGDWYVGEGLNPGDQFSYNLCFVDYLECTEFQIDWWVQGLEVISNEEKWVVQVVVYDGNTITTGKMHLGTVAPEPTGGDEELTVYRSAFKSSIVWLSAYATKDIGIAGKGPKAFTLPSWGKIANIGGEQILPTQVETLFLPIGSVETVRMQWKTGGSQSKVWIVDDFPFPVKASTWTHVSEGIPPQEYRFEILDYKQGVMENPFKDIVSTSGKNKELGCPQNYDLVKSLENTQDFKYLIGIKYGPEDPKQGCDIEWRLSFQKKHDPTEFLNQVQYDILTVDDSGVPLTSLAESTGSDFLFSASGQSFRTTTAQEVGTTHYVLVIYGLSPKHIPPSADQLDLVSLDIIISENPKYDATTPPVSSVTPVVVDVVIPSWVKNNAGFWVDGVIDDDTFADAIEYLINNKIIIVPLNDSVEPTSKASIPSWVKNNAGFWVDGVIDDETFALGLQYLVENGIIVV